MSSSPSSIRLRPKHDQPGLEFCSFLPEFNECVLSKIRNHFNNTYRLPEQVRVNLILILVPGKKFRSKKFRSKTYFNKKIDANKTFLTIVIFSETIFVWTFLYRCLLFYGFVRLRIVFLPLGPRYTLFGHLKLEGKLV